MIYHAGRIVVLDFTVSRWSTFYQRRASCCPVHSVWNVTHCSILVQINPLNVDGTLALRTWRPLLRRLLLRWPSPPFGTPTVREAKVGVLHVEFETRWISPNFPPVSWSLRFCRNATNLERRKTAGNARNSGLNVSRSWDRCHYQLISRSVL